MMAIRSILLSFTVLGAGALLLAACNRAPAAQESTPETKPQAASVPMQEPGMRAPLILTVKGPDQVPQAGDFPVDIEIQTSIGLKVPVDLRITLPDGVELVSGQLSESIKIEAATKLQRQVVLRTKAPLAAHVLVTADAHAADGAYGLHAERKYPQPAEPRARSNSALRPPISRPAQPPN